LRWSALTWTKATYEVSSMQTWMNSQHDDGDAAMSFSEAVPYRPSFSISRWMSSPGFLVFIAPYRLTPYMVMACAPLERVKRGGIKQPLMAIGYLAAIFRQAGHNVQVLTNALPHRAAPSIDAGLRFWIGSNRCQRASPIDGRIKAVKSDARTLVVVSSLREYAASLQAAKITYDRQFAATESASAERESTERQQHLSPIPAPDEAARDRLRSDLVVEPIVAATDFKLMRDQSRHPDFFRRAAVDMGDNEISTDLRSELLAQPADALTWLRTITVRVRTGDSAMRPSDSSAQG
jgi:hypothetical protein